MKTKFVTPIIPKPAQPTKELLKLKRVERIPSARTDPNHSVIVKPRGTGLLASDMQVRKDEVIIKVDNFEKMSNLNISEVGDVQESIPPKKPHPQQVLPSLQKFKKAVKITTKDD